MATSSAASPVSALLSGLKRVAHLVVPPVGIDPKLQVDKSLLENCKPHHRRVVELALKDLYGQRHEALFSLPAPLERAICAHVLNDPRDLRLLYTFIQIGAWIAFSCAVQLLLLPGDWRWALVHLPVTWGLFAQRFILAMHYSAHRTLISSRTFGRLFAGIANAIPQVSTPKLFFRRCAPPPPTCQIIFLPLRTARCHRHRCLAHQCAGLCRRWQSGSSVAHTETWCRLLGTRQVILANFFGMPAGCYYLHHCVMHHQANNFFPYDISSTMPYKRDSPIQFLACAHTQPAAAAASPAVAHPPPHTYTWLARASSPVRRRPPARYLRRCSRASRFHQRGRPFSLSRVRADVLNFCMHTLLYLPYYAVRKKRYGIAVGTVLTSVGYVATYVKLSAIAPVFFTTSLGVSALLGPFMLMLGNFSQHIFVDPERPTSNYALACNHVAAPFNMLTFNDGYHITHHVSSIIHWADMPRHFIEHLDAYEKGGAIIFEGIDFNDITINAWRGEKGLAWLAKRIVQITPEKLTEKELIEMMRARLQPVRNEKTQLDGPQIAVSLVNEVMCAAPQFDQPSKRACGDQQPCHSFQCSRCGAERPEQLDMHAQGLSMWRSTRF